MFLYVCDDFLLFLFFLFSFHLVYVGGIHIYEMEVKINWCFSLDRIFHGHVSEVNPH